MRAVSVATGIVGSTYGRVRAHCRRRLSVEGFFGQVGSGSAAVGAGFAGLRLRKRMKIMWLTSDDRLSCHSQCY